VNYDILMSKERKNCMCTAMLYDPKDHYQPEETAEAFKEKSKIYERWMRIKQGWSRILGRKDEAGKEKKSLLAILFMNW
jgi:hypothetical protein